MGEVQEEQRRVLIITALALEARAVQSHLRHLRVPSFRADSHYEIGEFQDASGSCQVILKESGARNKVCSSVTALAIRETRPHLTMLIGIAGSLRDVVPGDVVVPELVYDYESGKADDQLLPRPRTYRPDSGLLDQARTIARSERWLKRLPALPRRRPAVVCKPLAAGDLLMQSRQAEAYRFICTYYSDTVAIAMEDAGFLEAAYQTRTPAIVVRGISDQLDDKSERDAQGYQQLAAAHAAAFAFELLAQWLASSRQPASESPSAGPGPATATELVSCSPSLATFLQQLPDYEQLLREAIHILSTFRVIYKDQCRQYYQQLQKLDTHLKQALMDPPADLALRLRLDNLSRAIKQLQQAVEHLRHCCPPNSSRQEQRAYQEALEQTLQALKETLGCIERLYESLNKRPP
ncbi:MAG: hypothetical protein IRZ31_19535 [Thermogemmatispora sp.]|uniref:5'-methylthioadenosine/S-adenosylhomocysteine nucleosidase family protein n=1 Tax=Thermogemmatispora sp. TaxID=1968838 RepID=UPI0026116723|nr:hypothetical protein [Thermogemmatispora sp.]MBX5459091.1 hypothetical protein [Thermogemmatispora sp.]